ncbi:MAG: hypothetical protein AUJ52_12925 [Elusimicrobia bacterium CG1_02_63_36]|nr:MAG: hypothetical protein AUJ52_12925 [Elusimicrobia bacterium CG1_02_63_36]PIP82712.1 MAG: HAD family hydrolase [Elusimicrobia bacterium CG22_combo_CG10-13_8_21_14_all_63_91]PJA11955.1 MAG: HAD family hydrolase [Elusimicrobia bacterium CG_4_10_14_0_2_um_filter_63_34]PJB23800.1 MAG: HAD family hydrolase [Elusimicrobia bacterium CG_4_9_14_3_um_filter_62_55]
MSIRAVLFDLDGTLLDTLEDIGGAMNAVLERAGFPAHPIDAYKLMVGKGVRHLVESAAPAGKFSEDLLVSMREEYHKRSDSKTKPYPGVVDMLLSLKKRRIPFCVLSNKPQALTERAVERFFPAVSFAAVFGAREGVPLKPDPAGALEAATVLGIPPVEFLYLGDTGTDMETANAAGMRAVGALWGFRERPELEKAGASALIERPEELPALL